MSYLDRIAIERGVRLSAMLGDDTPPYVSSAPDWAARWGDAPPPVGTVLRWTTDAGVTHVAISISDDQWCMAEGEVDYPGRFEQIARVIANLPCDVAIAWRAVPQVEARPAGDDAVRDWAAQFLPVAEGPVDDQTYGVTDA